MPPPSLPPPERILWYSFRDLYLRFRMKKITKEQSQTEAETILRVYKSDREAFEQSLKIWSYHAELWQKIENAGIKYRKDRTLENADAFVSAVYGVGISQSVIKTEEGE